MAVAYESDGGTVFGALNSNAAIMSRWPATRPVGSVLDLICWSCGDRRLAPVRAQRKLHADIHYYLGLGWVGRFACLGTGRHRLRIGAHGCIRSSGYLTG